jgi:drug/metabolite transporter (DMT)-like permease
MNYIVLIFTAILAIMPILLVKHYIKTQNKMFLLIAFGVYLCMTYGYYLLFLKPDSDISIVFTLLLLLKILLVFLIGTIVLKESVTRNKIIGTLLAFASIYFLGIAKSI